MVGGMALPDGYKKGAKEVVFDLSNIAPEDFMYFIENKRLPEHVLKKQGIQ
jgi:hypothetical protein